MAPSLPLRTPTGRRGACATLAAVALGLLLGGCAEERACTLIGAEEGIGVDVPRGLYERSRTARIEVCDAVGCASTRRLLETYPPLPRPWATFADLGRRFDAGTVVVTVELRGPGRAVVARRQEDVELTPGYPNGRRCDGRGYLQGGLRLTEADAVDVSR